MLMLFALMGTENAMMPACPSTKAACLAQGTAGKGSASTCQAPQVAQTQLMDTLTLKPMVGKGNTWDLPSAGLKVLPEAMSQVCSLARGSAWPDGTATATAAPQPSCCRSALTTEGLKFCGYARKLCVLICKILDVFMQL